MELLGHGVFEAETRKGLALDDLMFESSGRWWDPLHEVVMKEAVGDGSH